MQPTRPLQTALRHSSRPFRQLSQLQRNQQRLHQPNRALSTTQAKSTAWSPQPSPPRLPKEEQEIFEQLQRESTGAFSTPISQRRSPPKVNQPDEQLHDASSQQAQPSRAEILRSRINQADQSTANVQVDQPAASTQTIEVEGEGQAVKAKAEEQWRQPKVRTGDGTELHPDVRRGARPEFEGEKNPKTGEVGGPKNEPLRWGGGVDWSYNGRVTDF